MHLVLTLVFLRYNFDFVLRIGNNTHKVPRTKWSHIKWQLLTVTCCHQDPRIVILVPPPNAYNIFDNHTV